MDRSSSKCSELPNNLLSERNLKGLSLAAGACLVAVGLQRRSFGGLALAAAGGYLAYYGYSRGGSSRARSREFVDRGPGDEKDDRGGPWEGQRRMPHAAAEWRPPEDLDEIDEASLESFPASDAPSFSGAAATPCGVPGERCVTTS